LYGPVALSCATRRASRHVVGDGDAKRPVRDVDLDDVAVLDQGDRAAGGAEM